MRRLRLSLGFICVALVVSACDEPTSQSGTRQASAGSTAFEVSKSTADAIGHGLSPETGTTIFASVVDSTSLVALEQAKRVTFTVPSSCGEFAMRSCTFETEGTRYTCASGSGYFRCDFETENQSRFRLTYLTDGRFVLASRESFQTGIWYQDTAGFSGNEWRELLRPIYDTMNSTANRVYRRQQERDAR